MNYLALRGVDCTECGGAGQVELPHRSGNPYIPKHATTLTLIQEILERKEQVVVFSAFTDPLDHLSRWLDEAGVRHCKLDGRTSQARRGKLAAVFKKGRNAPAPMPMPPLFTPESAALLSDIRTPGSKELPCEVACPVMLAGVECMAEGHSFHRANNVILIAYSWAYDKFIQAINRVHRMNSERSVNVYVVLCSGTIDRKLESLVGDKGDAAELVLDGRLIGERSEEINLAELLQIAHREFDQTTKTIDETLLQQQWPALRDRLAASQRVWDVSLPLVQSQPKENTMRRTNPIHVPKPITPSHTMNRPALAEDRLQTSAPAPRAEWKTRMRERVARIAATRPRADVWAKL
jgi:Helicase conserved C-terminal domain